MSPTRELHAANPPVKVAGDQDDGTVQFPAMTLAALVSVLALTSCADGEPDDPGSASTRPESPPIGPTTLEGDIAVSDEDDVRHGRWSPDGRYFAALIYEGHTDGTVAVAVGDAFQTVTHDLSVTSFAWMPDSESLLVAYDADEYAVTDPLEAPTRSELAIVSLDGTVLSELEVVPAVRAWYGISVDPTGSTAVAGGGPEGPHALDFDPTLLRIDLRTGASSEVLQETGEPLYFPQHIGDDRVAAMADGPDGPAGADDDHLVVVDTSTATSERLTAPNDQVSDFGVLRCAGQITYVSSGELQGFGNQSLRAIDIRTRQQIPVETSVRGMEVQPHPSGTGFLWRDYDPGRRPGQVRYHWQAIAAPPQCSDEAERSGPIASEVTARCSDGACWATCASLPSACLVADCCS
jgi:hypothetical protein